MNTYVDIAILLCYNSIEVIVITDYYWEDIMETVTIIISVVILFLFFILLFSVARIADEIKRIREYLEKQDSSISNNAPSSKAIKNMNEMAHLNIEKDHERTEFDDFCDALKKI